MREARGPAWTDWLRSHDVPALTGIDTRSLVLHLRERGAMRAAVVAEGDDVEPALFAVREQPGMTGAALVAEVSTTEPYVHNEAGAVRVAVVDYGAKRSILRRLAGSGASVTVFPHDVDADTLAGFDGVLLGICLGHQLLALATGLRTFKLPFGHHGANHPVLERASKRVLVTSQNHGFAVEASAGNAPTHESLYDGTVEGLTYPELRARSVQFHPEAGPGPHDAWSILAEWVEEVRLAAA
jgi:carbamoyl-phosphate synthase small subunit